MTKKDSPLGLGDIIYFDAGPKPQGTNHEEKKRRPWLVVSDQFLNKTTPFAVLVPITSTNSGFPTEVLLDQSKTNSRVGGVLLLEQMGSFDLENRDYDYGEYISPDLLPMAEIKDKIKALLNV